MLGTQTPLEHFEERVTLPCMNELRRIKPTPPSSPGIGMAGHHMTAGSLRPLTKNHPYLNLSYNSIYNAAVRPTGSCSQDIWEETFKHLMQVEAGELDGDA